MRRVALVPNPADDIKRVILYASEDGVYLFLSQATRDEGSSFDEWYAAIETAKEVCVERFGITDDMWQEVPDPEPGCQHDWIAPVRVKGREEGEPQAKQLERLVGGRWIPMDDPSP